MTGPRGRNERGASAVEYGLLAALIAAVITVAVIAFGGAVTGEFKDTKTSLCADPSKGSAQVSACAKG